VSEELCFEMTLSPGDIQFLDSHVTYHGRTPFEDDKEAGQDRLLLRLWLSMPNSRLCRTARRCFGSPSTAVRRAAAFARF
jgi:hypothetical protein